MCGLSSERVDLGDLELTAERKRELIDKLAYFVQGRGLESAAIFTLEVIKPMSWIGLQFLLGVSPLFIPLLNERTFNEYATLFEDRTNLELVVQRLEQVRQERESQEKRKKETQPKSPRLGFFRLQRKKASS